MKALGSLVAIGILVLLVINLTKDHQPVVIRGEPAVAGQDTSDVQSAAKAPSAPPDSLATELAETHELETQVAVKGTRDALQATNQALAVQLTQAAVEPTQVSYVPPTRTATDPGSNGSARSSVEESDVADSGDGGPVVASCAVGGGDSQDLTWNAAQGRLYMEPALNRAVKRQGSRCTVEFGRNVSFTLDSVEGAIRVDGARVGNGNGVRLRGTTLVITYQANDGSNGFDLFVDA